MEQKKIFCPFNSKCPVVKVCDYRIHYCFNKLNTICEDQDCMFEHNCYFGKSCKFISNDQCKLNHNKLAKKLGHSGSNEDNINADPNESLYCDKGYDCPFGFQCTYPHSLDYIIDTFERFMNQREKHEEQSCSLLQSELADYRQGQICRGFNCELDHSSSRFNEIYAIAMKYEKMLKDLIKFKRYYKKSDLETTRTTSPSKEKKIFCKNGIRCRILNCCFAHTVEEHVQKIIFHSLHAMKFEISIILWNNKVKANQINHFLYGTGKPVQLGVRSLEEHTEFYKSNIAMLNNLIILFTSKEGLKVASESEQKDKDKFQEEGLNAVEEGLNAQEDSLMVLAGLLVDKKEDSPIMSSEIKQDPKTKELESIIKLNVEKIEKLEKDNIQLRECLEDRGQYIAKLLDALNNLNLQYEKLLKSKLSGQKEEL